jgi:hypothetical protein
MSRSACRWCARRSLHGGCAGQTGSCAITRQVQAGRRVRRFVACASWGPPGGGLLPATTLPRQVVHRPPCGWDKEHQLRQDRVEHPHGAASPAPARESISSQPATYRGRERCHHHVAHCDVTRATPWTAIQWRARRRAQPPQGGLWACVGRGVAQISGFGQLRDRQRGVRQLARRIERHAQHAQQLFDELITGRVIDEFGIRQRHLQRGQHRTGDGGSGQPRLGLEEPARCHARPDVTQQARRHPALGLHVVHPSRTSTAEICGRRRHSRTIPTGRRPWRRPRRPR